MKNVFVWIKSSSGIIALTLLFLVVAGVLYGASLNMQNSTIGYEVEHTISPADASVVTIHGKELLNTTTFDQIRGRILNNVYGEHYANTGLVERQATYASGLEETGKDSYTFQITFKPSGTRYQVDISISNINEKNFSLTARKVS